MPTETAPQPSVAAPAAVVTPPPTPAPVSAAPERPINSVTKKPISEAAHNLFKMLEESGDPLREEPEKKEVPAAPVAAEPAKPAPTATEPPVKVSKKVAKRPELPIPAADPAPAAPVAKPDPAPVDSNWEEGLLEEEKIALEDAKFAEKVSPKHKGLADRMGRFLREQKKYLQENPDVDENDAGYKKILAMQPSLSASDKREIADARIEERVNKKHESKFADLEQEIYVRDEEPKIENEAKQIRHYLAFNALPKEMLSVLKDKGIDTLRKEYADEIEVAGNLINTLVDDSKELLRITRINAKTGRPIEKAADTPQHQKWEQHNRISMMVNEVCNDFHKTAPESEKVRDGKWFVTREEWARLPANARHQFWTFTNSEQHVREMINRAMGWMPSAIEQKIKERHEALKVRGYERRRSEVVTPPAAPPVASSAPSAPRPTPAPAPSSTPAGTPSLGQLLARRLSGNGEG
jgi:hypothetical protein